MKGLSYFAFILLFAGMCVSCSQAAPTDEMIEPGDVVGDLLVTTGGDENTTFLFDIYDTCDKSGNTNSCTVDEGMDINITYPVYNNTAEELEQSWPDFDIQVYVEGRKVNMPAFGTIDFDHPEYIKMRSWDVVLKDVKPGEFSIRVKGSMGDETFDDTFLFTVESAE